MEHSCEVAPQTPPCNKVTCPMMSTACRWSGELAGMVLGPGVVFDGVCYFWHHLLVSSDVSSAFSLALYSTKSTYHILYRCPQLIEAGFYGSSSKRVSEATQGTDLWSCMIQPAASSSCLNKALSLSCDPCLKLPPNSGSLLCAADSSTQDSKVAVLSAAVFGPAAAAMLLNAHLSKKAGERHWHGCLPVFAAGCCFG